MSGQLWRNFSLTPRFIEVDGDENLSITVEDTPLSFTTPLKQGVNERMIIDFLL
jgi:hypothetical protein